MSIEEVGLEDALEQLERIVSELEEPGEEPGAV